MYSSSASSSASSPSVFRRLLSWLRHALLALIVILLLGYLIPERVMIPVQGAKRADWNPRSFWYEPWGPSGVHKGIDIFAKRGQPVLAATGGVVIYQGPFGAGGNVVAVLGPHWHVHYYAHLDTPTQVPRFVSRGEQIGAVGTSGNAQGKPPHLHYAILSAVPQPWRITHETQGWRKMYYLDPGDFVGRS